MDLATAKATAGNDRASAETFCALVQGRLLSRRTASRPAPAQPSRAAAACRAVRAPHASARPVRGAPGRDRRRGGGARGQVPRVRGPAPRAQRRLARRARGWRPRRGVEGRGCVERDVAVRVPRGDLARARVRVQEGGDDVYKRRRSRRNGRVVDKSRPARRKPARFRARRGDRSAVRATRRCWRRRWSSSARRRRAPRASPARSPSRAPIASTVWSPRSAGSRRRSTGSPRTCCRT